MPRHNSVINPNGDVGKKRLFRELDQQIRPTNCILILSDMYVAHPYWIQREIELAQGYNKPIIGLEPRDQEAIPSAIEDAAIAIVDWNAQSIANAIRQYAL